MNKTILFCVTFFIMFLFNACTQRVTVRALEPAEVDRAAYTKKVAVASFQNDRVGLSSKIETKLARVKIDNIPYFTMVNRSDFKKVLREQRLQNSGLIDINSAVNIGDLIGAEAIISGNVGHASAQDSYFYEKRTRCVDKKCKKLEKYKVGCKKRVIGLSAEIRMVDVAKGDVIFADTFNPTKDFKHCVDDSHALPSREMVAQELAQSIARSFAYRLAPHYRNFRVSLLSDPDLDYSDKQEELLKFSLEYIEQGRYDKAEKLLMDLIDSTDSQSYVAFYNLGVIKEAQGKYIYAKEYYEYADNLMIEPVQEINSAVNRIDSLIKKHELSENQLHR